jgi:probable rRNA maturation factor
VPSLLPLAALERLIARTLAAAHAPAPASIGLVLSHDAELAALNRRAMGRRGPTDVLSFPLLSPSVLPAHAGQDPAVRRGAGATGGDLDAGVTPRDAAVDFALPPGVRPHLGDVVVSIERAIAQALDGHGGQSGDRSWSPSDELRLLVVHGTLHVCGWDHARPAEEAAMRALERDLLAAPDRIPAARTKPQGRTAPHRPGGADGGSGRATASRSPCG